MQKPGEFVREQVSTVREHVDRVAGSVADPAVRSQVGDFIREQRSAAKVSLRELARTAGVSNPYLSQVERGLRKPSAEILSAIARGLSISAETLYEQAGILARRGATDLPGLPGRDPREGVSMSTTDTVRHYGETVVSTGRTVAEQLVERSRTPLLAVVGAGDFAVKATIEVVET